MSRDDAGARVERQIVVQPFVAAALQRIALRVVDFLDRLLRQVADREPAHFVRRRHVAVEQRGRGRQHRGDVVEAVAGIVDRQPLARSHVDAQQIADGIAVLRAVEAMRGRATRVRMRRRRAVDGLLEKRRERRRGWPIGPIPHRRRRHLARAHLPGDLLPDLCLRGHVGEIEVLKRETGRLRTIVVAADAVRADEYRVGRHRSRLRRERRRGADDERRGDEPYHGAAHAMKSGSDTCLTPSD